MKAWLLSFCILSVGLVGCQTVANKTYCDATTPCSGAQQCVANKCVGANGMVDLREADTDMPMTPDPDLLGPDLLDAPDLKPECTSSAECTTASKPVCGAGGVCRACQDATDDTVCAAKSATRCITTGSNAGQCGACNPDTTAKLKENADCAAALATTPVCTESGSCTACTAHTQCASLVCNFTTGACTPQGDVAYVDNRGTTSTENCSDSTHAGTLADPYCEIADGLANLGARSVIRVFGTDLAYKAVSITTASATALRIIGPGTAATPTARIFELNVASVVVALGSGVRTVALEGFVIGDEASVNADKRGVSCAGSGATINLTLRDVRILRAGAEGIFSDTCSLTVTQSTVSGNTGAGVSATGGTLTVTQSTVSGNTGAGVSATGGTLTVTQSTVSGNTGAGVSATGGTLTVTQSTVSGNTGAGVSATGGTLTVTQSTVSGNTQGGVSVNSSANYALSNMRVFRNGTGGGSGSEYGGLRLDSNNGFVANATVYANTSKSGRAAGVRCADPDPIVLNTVILDSVGGTDIEASKCNFQSSAFKSAAATRDLTTCSATQLFVDPDNDDYHVKSGTNPCNLVGGGAASFMTATAPSVDYDGVARPSATTYEIGAYELP